LKSIPPEYNATAISLRQSDRRNVGHIENCAGGGDYKYQFHQSSLLNTKETGLCIVRVPIRAKGLVVFSLTKFYSLSPLRRNVLYHENVNLTFRTSFVQCSLVTFYHLHFESFSELMEEQHRGATSKKGAAFVT
jgi:hypothetical protein